MVLEFWVMFSVVTNQRLLVIGRATGMDQNSASTLLETLAPLVMGAVGQTTQQNSLDRLASQTCSMGNRKRPSQTLQT
jgi:hypothetical protein